MTINGLFNDITNSLSFDDIKGEVSLNGNCIEYIYTYRKDDIDDEINIKISNEYDEDDVDNYYNYCYNDISIEEKVLEIYNKDKEIIDALLYEIGEIDNWYFSEPEICDDVITFKLF